MTQTMDMDNRSTKEKIFTAAVQLFSDNGYKEVSMRDIAKRVGINVSSLYNHYDSKEELLNALYEFFADEWQQSCPDMQEILRLAETEPPHDVLTRMNFHYDLETADIMERIIRISVRQITVDNNSEAFFRKHVLDGPAQLLTPVLTCMIERGRIEPLDIDAMIRLLTNYTAGVVMLNNTSLHLSSEEWQDGLKLIYRMVVATGK